MVVVEQPLRIPAGEDRPHRALQWRRVPNRDRSSPFGSAGRPFLAGGGCVLAHGEIFTHFCRIAPGRIDEEEPQMAVVRSE